MIMEAIVTNDTRTVSMIMELLEMSGLAPKKVHVDLIHYNLLRSHGDTKDSFTENQVQEEIDSFYNQKR